MCYIGINNYSWENAFKIHVLIPGILTTVMLWANYPMTQIYQHEEDEKHGDMTISRKLGIRGTFYFVSAIFTVVSVAFVLYFYAFFESKYAWTFLAALLPVVAYFFVWFFQTYQDPAKADFSRTMRLNFISATALNAYFVYLFLDSTHVGQTL